MKVALLSDCYPPRTGGIESQVSDLAAHLAVAGHEVEVFTATPGAEGAGQGAVERSGAVTVHRMSTPWAAGVPVNPFARSEVSRRLRSGAFDVAHVHLGVVSPFAWDMVGVTTRADVPTALTWHCVLGRAGPVLGPAVRRWAGRGAVLSAVSGFAAQGVRRAAKGEPVTVLPNGIDPAVWSGGPATGRSRPVRVVTASRLAPRKRIGALLEVVAAAHDRVGPGAMTLDLYGDGPLRPWLEARVRALGLSHVVRLRGRVTRSRLAEAWADADVYLSPTRLEAFGIAALEARTAGLPVIARGDSGVREVITDGVSGLLADDDDGLGDALVRLVADETLRTRINRHNIATPPAQTWDRVVELALSEYRRAGA